MAMFSPLDDYDRKTLVDMAVEADLAACKRLRGIVGQKDRLDAPGMRGHRRQFGAEEFCKLFNLKVGKIVTIPMALMDETGPNMEDYIDAKPKAKKRAVPFGYEQGLRDGGGLNPARPRFRGYGQAQVDDPIQWIPQEAIRAEDPAANPGEAQPRRGVQVVMERDGYGRMAVPLAQIAPLVRDGWRLVREGNQRDEGLPAMDDPPPPQVQRAEVQAQVRNYADVDIDQHRMWVNDYLEVERQRIQVIEQARAADAALRQDEAVWRVMVNAIVPPQPAPQQRMQDVLDRQMQQIVDEDPF